MSNSNDPLRIDPENQPTKSIRKASGHVFIDGREVGDTIQCCHCGAHFLSIRGSGKIRGWCFNCAGVTCGRPQCLECMHFQKKLELYEAGKRSQPM